MSKDKKIDSTQGIDKVGTVKRVTQVDATQNVDSVKRVSSTAKTSAASSALSLTAKNREVILSTLMDEANKLLGKDDTPRKRKVVKAVQIAIESGLIEEDED